MAHHCEYLITEQVKGVLVVQFSRPDVMDQHYIELVGLELASVVEGLEHPYVLIDFEGVQFLSSSALGMLVRIYKLVHERGGGLRICNVRSETYEVFKVTDFEKLLRPYTNRAAALKHFP